MEGDPGSMSAYARAKRDMFGKGEGGPIAYGIKCDSISKRKGVNLIQFCIDTQLIGKNYLEMIAPFDTTGTRLLTPTQDGPGPIYFPFKRDRWQRVCTFYIYLLIQYCVINFNFNLLYRALL
jgi:hypothetical protein